MSQLMKVVLQAFLQECVLKAANFIILDMIHSFGVQPRITHVPSTEHRAYMVILISGDAFLLEMGALYVASRIKS